jgi:hypothetical protein
MTATRATANNDDGNKDDGNNNAVRKLTMSENLSLTPRSTLQKRHIEK